MKHGLFMLIIRLVFLIGSLVWFNSLAQSQSIQLSLEGSMNCSDDTFCATIQLSSDGDSFDVGSSSVYLTYNPSALQLINYTALNFDSYVSCDGQTSFWYPHSFDFNNTSGEFLVTTILTTDYLSCPSIDSTSIVDLGIICFDVIDSDVSPELAFGTNLTAFNSSANNSIHIPIGSHTGIDNLSALNCSINPNPEPELGVELSVRVWLEGYLDTIGGQMVTSLWEGDLLPLEQPFDISPIFYSGAENLTQFPDSTVDWALLELRDIDTVTTTIFRKAVLINKDGWLMDFNGLDTIKFNNVEPGDYHVIVRHKSHLAVASAEPLALDSIAIQYDFTTSDTLALGNEQMKTFGQFYVMYCGDYDHNGIHNNMDHNVWQQNKAGVNAYFSHDGDGNGVVNNLDYNLWKRNKSKVGASMIQY